MDKLSFIKMHGLGNDFIIIDQRNGGASLEACQIIKLADRTCGIGFDQIIHLKKTKSAEADVFLDMYNADGSPLEACGNATRCVASLLMKETGRDEIVVQTVAGLLKCRAVSEDRTMIEADMGAPKLGWRDIPLAVECDTLHLSIGEEPAVDPVGVNVGNPHAVFFVEDAENLPVGTLGPRFEHDPLFPQKANIEFAEVLDRAHIRMRVWERGAGETKACGSGACATIVAAVRRGLADRRCEVMLNGGPLTLHWREENDHILMTGPAAYVFEGIVPL